LKIYFNGFFLDVAELAGTEVTGGQTIQNESIILGGVAMSVCSEEHFIRPENAQIGDVIVLTKALGTQVSVNAYEWLTKDSKKIENLKEIISENEIVDIYDAAAESMSRLNQNGAKLMHKYEAHCATDVTGFGILGHATNLVQNQKLEVDFEIDTLPVLKKMVKIDDSLNSMFKLKQGFSAETSGGLFICMSKENAEKFCKEIEELDSYPAWIIGRVVKGSKKAKIVENVSILEV
jgi:selenide, water dikinase